MPAQYKSYTLKEATSVLEKYCTYQERCHQEVHQKLRSMRMIPEAIDQITVHLINQGYLNEERFAKSYVLGKFRIKNWGRIRIRLELAKRNISKNVISLAISELDDATYLNKFHELAEKRWRQLRTENNTRKKKRKMADYLLYRGWETHLVYDKIAELN